MSGKKSNIHFLENDKLQVSTTANLGIDMDPENDPTYPMRKRYEGDNKGINWARPQQQKATVEVLKSTEYPTMPAVFGTSVPPRGLSGMLRRKAYKYSESSFYRWLPLILADRIDMVEGILEDLKTGHIPNIWKEKGMRAGMRHNPAGVVKKVAIKGGIIVLLAYVAFRSAKRK